MDRFGIGLYPFISISLILYGILVLLALYLGCGMLPYSILPIKFSYGALHSHSSHAFYDEVLPLFPMVISSGISQIFTILTLMSISVPLDHTSLH